jgi:N-acyl-D-amino-acid deacylase
MPGLVDSHVHGEGALFEPRVQRAMLKQGVTSVVLGQDGVSFAPSPAGTGHCAAKWAENYFAAINGAAPRGFSQGSIADFLEIFDETTALNVGYLIPHGTVRYAVKGGGPGAATDAELAQMSALVREGLRDGACGISTGLEYTPAKFSDTRELTELLQIVADHGLPHVSHMRGYESAAVTALEELRSLAVATGIHTHVSHLHGPHREITEALDAFGTAGLGITYDTYPYLRGCTILSMLALPSWLPVADVDATLAALGDPEQIARLHREHLDALDELWPRVTLAAVPGELSWTEGLSLPEAATRLGLSPADCLIELLRASRLRASAVFAQPPTNSPESVRQFALDERHVAGSDAIYQGGSPHPRGWGTFANYLRTYVIDGQNWTLADAARHLARRSAELFRFTSHGHLGVGKIADIALLDLDQVRDTATYADPQSEATGIDTVIVRGTPVLRDGELTGATPGRPLRPEPR